MPNLVGRNRATLMLNTGLGLAFALLVAIATFPSAQAQSSSPQAACPGEKRALVVSGGGVKGAYQVGALWYLVNVLNCNFEQYFGTSTGAVTAAVLAQSTNRAELAEKVELLVAEYSGIHSASQIASERFLGTLRFLLPRWLGGVDGVATLAPLEERLKKYIPDSRVPHGRLSIAVTSLQGGNLDPRLYQADNVHDLVIGSASIPMAIEPRRARFWIGARPVDLSGEVLTVELNTHPGLPDPRCELQSSKMAPLRCEVLYSEAKISLTPWSSETEFLPSLEREGADVYAKAKLRLPELSNSQRALLSKMVEEVRGTVTVTYGPLQMSTVHQVVDGGVTANIPLASALRLLGREHRFDTIFTLFAGHSANLGQSEREVRGGTGILGSSFEILWEAYQTAAIRSAEHYLRVQQLVCAWYVEQRDVLIWHAAIERKFGREALGELYAQRPKLTIDGDVFGIARAIIANCEEGDWKRWKIITFDPGVSEMEGPLAPDHSKIIAAIGSGCATAAAELHRRFRIEESEGVSTDESERYAKIACEPLIRRLR